MLRMEILKNVVLAVHIIGIASLLGGVMTQMGSMRQGKPRVVPAIMHGGWTMLITGIALVGLQYSIGHEVNNPKITVKLLVLVAILAIALVHRRREALPAWVLRAIGGLTVVNVLLATVWKSYGG